MKHNTLWNVRPSLWIALGIVTVIFLSLDEIVQSQRGYPHEDGMQHTPLIYSEAD